MMKRYMIILLMLLVVVFALVLLTGLQAQAGRNSGPNVDYNITDLFDTSHILNEDDYAEVFYGDALKLIPDVEDPDGDAIVQYEWTFEVNETGNDLVTMATIETVGFMVGLDHLYSNEDGGEPVMPALNSDPVDYIVTLEAWDENNNKGEHSMDVRVHPYAMHIFMREVIMGNATMNATVSLIWRGLPEEAASSSDEISPVKPVYVYIDETFSPDPNLTNTGGLGQVYDIRAVGCILQDGEEGFIQAEITLPVSMSDLEEIGDPFYLQDDLRLEYYDEIEKRFFAVAGSHLITEQEANYVVGTVDHFSIYATIVESVYTYDPSVLPDLIAYGMETSRSPVLHGQEMEIRGWVKNDGHVHARNVDVHFYDDDTLMDIITIDIVRSGEMKIVTISHRIFTIDPEAYNENNYIKMFVNKEHIIMEAPGSYNNNNDQMLIMAINSDNTPPTINITQPMNGTAVKRTITIKGTADDGSSDVIFGISSQPFGNNDFSFMIQQVNPYCPSVLTVDFMLRDRGDNDNLVSGVGGNLKDIYGSNFDDMTTKFSYKDNDRDGRVSAGDIVLAKNVINGGIVYEAHYLELNFSKVKCVEVSIDNGSWVYANGTENWNYKWDSSVVEKGNISLMFRAYDGDAYSEVREIILEVQDPGDNTIPTISITNPANNAKISGKVKIQGTALDEDGTVERVEISIDGGDWIIINLKEPWDYELDTEELENGEYRIKVRCYDGEDYSTEFSITVTIENNGDGDGFISGFNTIILMNAVGIAIFLFARKENKSAD